MTSPVPTVTVVICTYTDERWDMLVAAVASARSQLRQSDQLVIVVDNNPTLLERSTAAFPDANVVANASGTRGISESRNTGIAHAESDVVAFLDDDAVAAPTWLQELRHPYEDLAVLGVGSYVQPLWLGTRPSWFPDQFGWVVGCSYAGLPEATAPVRNLLGNGMSFRKLCFSEAGLFLSDLGRKGADRGGCEETEFCIRLAGHFPRRHLLYVPAAQVQHNVSAQRLTVKYFLSRCFAEGLSKDGVRRHSRSPRVLSSERHHALRVLPAAVLSGLRRALAGDMSGATQALMISVGLGTTVAGYLTARIGLPEKRPALGRYRGSRGHERTSRAALTAATPLTGHRDPARAGSRSLPSAPGRPPQHQGIHRLRSGVTRGSLLHFERPAGVRTPVLVADLEITSPITGLDLGNPSGPDFAAAQILVRLHGHPMGMISVSPSDIPPSGFIDGAHLAQLVWSACQPAIARHLRRDAIAPPTSLAAAGLLPVRSTNCSWQAQLNGSRPSATVCVATCGESLSSLRRTVHSALQQTYDNADVLVVDNRPGHSGLPTSLWASFPDEERLHYAAETTRGLAAARNRSLQAARTDIIAMTDDDVHLDPNWLGFLVAAFDRPEVACVTGAILPSSLANPAQLLIEEFGGFSKGFDHRRWDLGANRLPNPIYPYLLGTYGSGASAAWRRSHLEQLGGYDTHLGTGTPARGGEDLDIYLSCIRAGFQIVYQPAALLWHAHHGELAQVRRQVFGYGVGLGAVLTKHFLSPEERREMLGRLPTSLAYLLDPKSPKNMRKSRAYPATLTLLELAGITYGPFAYRKSRLAR